MTINNQYVDEASALKRVGGNRKLYIKLLAQFKEGGYIKQLEDLINSGSIEEAAASAHTIKGVTANLSLLRLNTISIELERRLKSGEDHSDCLSDLKQAYDETLKQISEIS